MAGLPHPYMPRAMTTQQVPIDPNERRRALVELDELIRHTTSYLFKILQNLETAVRAIDAGGAEEAADTFSDHTAALTQAVRLRQSYRDEVDRAIIVRQDYLDDDLEACIKKLAAHGIRPK